MRELFLKECSERGIDKKDAVNLTDKLIRIVDGNFTEQYAYCVFDLTSENSTCTIEYEIGFFILEDLDEVEDFFDALYDDSIDSNRLIDSYLNDSMYGGDAYDLFFEEIYKLSDYASEFKSIFNDVLSDNGRILDLGTYGIEIINDGLFFQGTNLEYLEDVQKIIYDTLVSNSDLLPDSFDANEKANLVRKSLSNDDYQNSAIYSHELEIYDIICSISRMLAEMLKIRVKQSEVITLSMPMPLSSVIELARDNKSRKEFIAETCRNYFDSNPQLE